MEKGLGSSVALAKEVTVHCGNDSIEYESFFGLVKNDSYLLDSWRLSNQIDQSVVSAADQALHDVFGRLN